MRWADIRAMLLIVIALCIAACSDSPTEPVVCRNCKPLLADLKMDTTYIATPMTRDSARKRNVLPPGNVKIVFVVENVGDTASLPGKLSVGNAQILASDSFGSRDFPLPSIPPHSIFTDTVEARPWDSHFNPFFAGSSSYFFIYAGSPNDNENNNNSKRTVSFYLTKATLTFPFPGTVVTVRVNERFAFPFTVKNDGYAPSPAYQLNGCLGFVYMDCGDNTWTSFPAFSIPSLQPGESYLVKDSMVVTAASAFQDEQFSYTLAYCGSAADPNLGGCGGAFHIVVQPDYESSCHPPVLTAASPLQLTAFNCGLTATTTALDGIGPLPSLAFHLIAVDAQPGVTYRVTREDPTATMRVYDADGAAIDDLDPAADRFAIATAGRYYIVTYDVSPAQTYSLVVQ